MPCPSEMSYRYVETLVADAVAKRGIPAELARLAAHATTAWMKDDAAPAPLSERRLRAYFWGVIRRRCLASNESGLSALRARFVLESIRRDLASSGRTPRQVEAELRAYHADLLSVSDCEGQLAFSA